jgi:hypothetical protein
MEPQKIIPSKTQQNTHVNTLQHADSPKHLSTLAISPKTKMVNHHLPLSIMEVEGAESSA